MPIFVNSERLYKITKINFTIEKKYAIIISVQPQAEGNGFMKGDNSILIFSQQGDTLDKLCLSASEYGFSKITVSDGTNADALFETVPSLVLINAPLGNEFGLDLAVTASKHGFGVIIAVPPKICEDVSAKIGNRSIFVLPKPINTAVLKQIFRFVMLSKASSDVLKTEKEQLESKIRDMKLVDRAKCALMQYLRIPEAEAHRQIQKRAMDMRLSQAEVAQDILKTYEM